MADIALPQLGESVTEGTITRWFKAVGEAIAMDEPLFEVSTDKVDTEVPSPIAGVVTELLVPEGETIDVGTVVARVAVAGEAPAAAAPEAPAAPAAEPAPVAVEIVPEPAPVPATPEPVTHIPAPAAPEPTPAPAPVEAPAAAVEASAPVAPAAVEAPAAAPAASSAPAPLLSPVVRRIIEDNNLDVSTIVGTGVGGRITRDDVLALVDQNAAAGAAGAASVQAASASEPAAVSAPMPAASVASAATAAPVAAAPAPIAAPPVVAAASAAPAVVTDGSTLVPFSNIRRRTGEHMVMSKATSPHTVTAVMVDYENIERARRAHKEKFKADEGFSLTYLPFISRAVVEAIEEFPNINATVTSEGLMVHHVVNLSIAVDLNFEGLLAPVVHSANDKRLAAIAREIHSVATDARSKKLGPDSLAGGTFTISNSGSFGTFQVIPIINQPQVAILSTDGVSRQPVVVTDSSGNESLAIHSVGLLTLAWDHRAFDGAYAAAFMQRLAEVLETRDWMAEL